MSSNKNNDLITKQIITPDDQEIAVSESTARAYYIMKDTIFIHNVITFALMTGIFICLIFYMIYSYKNNELLKEASKSCPVFFCPSAAGKTAPPCQGKAYHIKAGGEIVCTE